MSRKILILDTSILCVWMKVTGKETCGSGESMLTYDIVNAKIEEEKEKGTTFVLPIASIIETGNHIAHSSGDKYQAASCLVDIINKSADEESPWAAFTQQGNLWQNEALKELALRWQETVVSGQSLGDASIVDVANYYSQADFEVEIFTGDAGLKAYEPKQKAITPPRRRKKN